METGHRASSRIPLASSGSLRVSRRRTAGLAALALLTAVMLLAISGCGGSSTATDTTAGPAAVAGGTTPQDQAAHLAAQAQLRNAQTAQESYYAENERYAVSLDELKSASPGMTVRVEVTRGDKTGYEMRVTSNDSTHTVFILRKNGSRIERVDSNGNNW